MASGKSRGFGLFFAIVTVAIGVAVAWGFSRGWLPEVASEHGKGVDGVIHYLMWSTGVLFLVGHLALGYFIFKYSKDQAQANAAVSHRTEAKAAIAPVLAMMAVSEIGVLVVGLPVFDEIYGEAPADAITIEVVGKQFEWLVRYAGPDGVFGKVDPKLVHDSRNPLGLDKKDPAAKDDIVKRGVVTIPVDKTCVVNLRSHDVIHSFTVPFFRTKQDTLPGFTARTKFVPTKEGQFELACAELCGLGHYRMQGKVVVMNNEDYEKWLSEQESWL